MTTCKHATCNRNMQRTTCKCWNMPRATACVRFCESHGVPALEVGHPGACTCTSACLNACAGRRVREGDGGLGVYSLAKHAFSMRARTACGSALAAEYTTPYAKYTQSPRTSVPWRSGTAARSQSCQCAAQWAGGRTRPVLRVLCATARPQHRAHLWCWPWAG
jgi:hypothetical protein